MKNTPLPAQQSPTGLFQTMEKLGGHMKEHFSKYIFYYLEINISAKLQWILILSKNVLNTSLYRTYQTLTLFLPSFLRKSTHVRSLSIVQWIVETFRQPLQTYCGHSQALSLSFSEMTNSLSKFVIWFTISLGREGIQTDTNFHYHFFHYLWWERGSKGKQCQIHFIHCFF